MEHGKVDYLINNALPVMKGISECSYEEFNYALRVGVSAPFYLTKLFLPHFTPRRGDCKYFFIPRPHEPAADRKLYCLLPKAALRHLPTPWRSVLAAKPVSTPSPQAGLIPLTRNIQVRMPHSILPAEWGIPWTSPTWCCISAPVRPVLSRQRISALTAAWRNR